MNVTDSDLDNLLRAVDPFPEHMTAAPVRTRETGHLPEPPTAAASSQPRFADRNGPMTTARVGTHTTGMIRQRRTHSELTHHAVKAAVKRIVTSGIIQSAAQVARTSETFLCSYEKCPCEFCDLALERRSNRRERPARHPRIAMPVT